MINLFTIGRSATALAEQTKGGKQFIKNTKQQFDSAFQKTLPKTYNTVVGVTKKIQEVSDTMDYGRLFSDEKAIYNAMREDGMNHHEIIQGLKKQRRREIINENLGGDDRLTKEEILILKAMREDGISAVEASGIIRNRRIEQYKKENAIFKDIHADENIVEQALKSPFRGVKDTGKHIGKNVVDGAVGLSTMVLRGVNDLHLALGTGFGDEKFDETVKNTTGSEGYMSDALKVGANVTGAIFNTAKAPVAIGVNTANHAPGAQYAMQGLSKAIGTGAEWAGGNVGLNKEDSKNLAATVLNTIGLRAPLKGTHEVVAGAKNAYKASGGGIKGATNAGMTTLKEGVIGPSVDMITMPVRLATTPIKALGNKIQKGGEAIQKTAFKPNKNEATQIIDATAKGKVQPTTQVETAVKYNLKGTEKQIGVQAKRMANKIFEEKIVPAMNQSKSVFDINTIFKQAENHIRSTEASALRRTELLEGMEALKADFLATGKTKYSVKELQAEKSSLDAFTPQKVFNGKDVSSGYTMAKNTIANMLRKEIYKDLEANGIKNARELYRDYGNLQNLSEMGVKALTQQRMNAGFGGFVSGIKDTLITPAVTMGGAGVARAGKLLQGGKVSAKMGEWIAKNGVKSGTAGGIVEKVGGNSIVQSGREGLRRFEVTPKEHNGSPFRTLQLIEKFPSEWNRYYENFRSMWNGKIKHAEVGKMPEKYGKSSIFIEKGYTTEINNAHGLFSAKNMIITINNPTHILDNAKGIEGRINFIKEIEGGKQYFIIGVQRFKEGDYVVHHMEVKNKTDTSLKTLLSQGEIIK